MIFTTARPDGSPSDAAVGHRFTVELASGVAPLARVVLVLHGMGVAPTRFSHVIGPVGAAVVLIETTQREHAAERLHQRLARLVDVVAVAHDPASTSECDTAALPLG